MNSSPVKEEQPLNQELRRGDRERVKRKIKLPGEETTEVETDDGTQQTGIQARPPARKIARISQSRSKPSEIKSIPKPPSGLISKPTNSKTTNNSLEGIFAYESRN